MWTPITLSSLNRTWQASACRVCCASATTSSAATITTTTATTQACTHTHTLRCRHGHTSQSQSFSCATPHRSPLSLACRLLTVVLFALACPVSPSRGPFARAGWCYRRTKKKRLGRALIFQSAALLVWRTQQSRVSPITGVEPFFGQQFCVHLAFLRLFRLPYWCVRWGFSRALALQIGSAHLLFVLPMRVACCCEVGFRSFDKREYANAATPQVLLAYK